MGGTLADLPDGVLAKIQNDLDTRSLARLCCVCRPLRCSAYLVEYLQVPASKTVQLLGDEANFVRRLCRHGAKVRRLKLKGAPDANGAAWVDGNAVVQTCSKHLEELQLLWTRHSAPSLYQLLSPLRCLRRLSVTCYLGEQPFSQLTGLVLPALEHIAIEVAQLSCCPATGLIPFLNNCPQLRTLDCKNLSFGGEGLERMPPALTSVSMRSCENVHPGLLWGCGQLESVVLHNCFSPDQPNIPASEHLEPAESQLWMQVFQGMLRLRSLQLDFCHSALHAIASSCHALERLDILCGDDLDETCHLPGRQLTNHFAGALCSSSLREFVLQGAQPRGPLRLECDSLALLLVDNPGYTPDMLLGTLQALRRPTRSNLQAVCMNTAPCMDCLEHPCIVCEGAIEQSLSEIPTLKCLASSTVQLTRLLRHRYPNVIELYIDVAQQGRPSGTLQNSDLESDLRNLQNSFPALRSVQLLSSLDRDSCCSEAHAELLTAVLKAQHALPGITFQLLDRDDFVSAWYQRWHRVVGRD